MPQPYRLQLGHRWYIPDIYYTRGGTCYVAELKPAGKFDPQLTRACEAFFARRGITYVTVANEAVFAQAIAAQNWLSVVRWLVSYAEADTTAQEEALYRRLLLEGELSYGHIADLGDRDTYLLAELAIHRLLHAGHPAADLEQRFLDAETVVRLC